MDLNHARSEIRRMINTLRAYEKAEEVLNVLAAAEANVGDLARRRDALSAEIPTIEAEKTKIAESLEAARTKAREEVTKVEAETADRLSELRQQLEAEEGRVHSELAALHGRLEAAIEEHRIGKETMEREAAELTGRIAALKENLRAMARRHQL